MCGRFTLTSNGKDLMDDLEISTGNSNYTWQPSYNIYPAQKIPVITFNNERIIQGMFWGLIPSWSKNIKIGHRIINAREETLTEKSSYKNLVQSQRCIVIADGYYEWMQTSHGKKPYYIFAPENIILPFAGLWNRWENDEKQHKTSCTIITTEASKQLKHIHNRMPVIIDKDRIDEWIDCNHPQGLAIQLLKPYSHSLEYYPVSTFVNTPINNSLRCIEPIKIEE